MDWSLDKLNKIAPHMSKEAVSYWLELMREHAAM